MSASSKEERKTPPNQLTNHAQGPQIINRISSSRRPITQIPISVSPSRLDHESKGGNKQTKQSLLNLAQRALLDGDVLGPAERPDDSVALLECFAVCEDGREAACALDMGVNEG